MPVNKSIQIKFRKKNLSRTKIRLLLLLLIGKFRHPYWCVPVFRVSVVPLDSVPKLNYRFVGFGRARKFPGSVFSFFFPALFRAISHTAVFLSLVLPDEISSPFIRGTTTTPSLHEAADNIIPRCQEREREYTFSSRRRPLLISLGVLPIIGWSQSSRLILQRRRIIIIIIVLTSVPRSNHSRPGERLSYRVRRFMNVRQQFNIYKTLK